MKQICKTGVAIVYAHLWLSLIVLSNKALAQSGTWITKAPMPTARYALAAGVVNGKLYTIGGAVSGGSGVATVDEYNPGSNTWSSKANMPDARGHLAVGVVNNKIYAIGSANEGDSNILEYDPGSNTWSTKASISRRYALAVGVVGNKIYIIGGNDGSTGLSTVLEYDPATDLLTTKASMSTLRSYLAAGVVNDKIYAVGGGDNSSFLSLVEEYNPATDTWTKKTSMPTPRHGLAVGVLNSKIYAVGGADGTGALAIVEEYDPSTDTWATTTSMTTPRASIPAAGVISGILYVIGGADTTDIVASNEAFIVHPALLSIKDVPNDQGGRVTLTWSASSLDVDVNTLPFYSIWRSLPDGVQPQGTLVSAKEITVNYAGHAYRVETINGVTYAWEWLANQPAHRFSTYSYAAPTMYDSTSSTNGTQYFLVSAQTTNSNVFYDSNPDIGYSVDNLAPIPPAGLVAAVQPGPQVKLTWNPPTDPDVKSYAIYRSMTNGFTPAPGNNIGTSLSTSFTDASPVSGVPSYYRIIAVDVHDNQSLPSPQATAAVTTTQQLSVQAKWNMVSVPLTVNDNSKTALFPSAVSNAYAYNVGYVAYAALTNGRGYWVKFPSPQTVSIAGLLRTIDTISVVPGWNMIGSLSTSISVSSISSIPGSIVTSSFYGYKGIYQASQTIEPGVGYWVKVSHAGKLVLSSTGNAPSSSRIRVEDAGEKPPMPPDGVSSEVPETYRLEQNYPNPFNPVTTISYALPVSEHVMLSVYNMLGEEVAVLVDENQGAGYKSVYFDAGGLPSGMCFYRISAGAFTNEKKLLLVK